MIRVVRAVFISACCALVFHLLKTFLTDRHENHLEINYLLRTPKSLKIINREIKINGTSAKYITQFKRPERLPSDLKYILKWTEIAYYRSIFKTGQQSFLDNKCTHYNCYITGDRNLLTDIKYFDAILFDVENTWNYLPPLRMPFQKYIFMGPESADHYPICNPYFESYYNLTWTYKLDSDIRWSYVSIFDKSGKLIGPDYNMSWIIPMNPTPEYITDILKTKKKAVAWFVFNSRSNNRREEVAKNISQSLAKFNLKMDVYGWGENLTCPKDQIDECMELLRTDYYFYLAFENSNSEDYVTEKILYPLQHYTVPIVYGGADYSRFLPPDSYINARTLDSETIAFLIYKATKNLEEYSNYFRWHNYYGYTQSPPESDLCVLCRLLNDNTEKSNVVTNFRQWWNPDYKKICKNVQNEQETEP